MPQRTIVVFYLIISLVITWLFYEANRTGSRIFELGGVGPSRTAGTGPQHK